MAKIYDIYCIDAVDLSAARKQLEEAISVTFVLHESMYWGGDYYLARSERFGKITIRSNFNTFTGELNERDFPGCRLLVSVSVPLDPPAVESQLAAAGLRLLRRTIL